MSASRKSAQPETPARVTQTQSSAHRWAPLALLGLACLVFFAPVLLGQAWFWEDLIHQEFPHRIFARDMILSGKIPHWNPYTFGGMPFFSAIHTGTLYPANFLLSLIPAPAETFWYLLQLSIIAHFAAAGLCMYAFIRSRKLSVPAALLGATSYMLCGFFVTHLIHSLMLGILVWTPLAMLLLQKSAAWEREKREKDDSDRDSDGDREKGKRGESLFGARYPVLTGLLLGATIFAGHPQITFYQFLFLGLFCVYLLREQKCVARITLPLVMRLFSPFVIAAGIALVQLLPTAELGGESMRSEWTFAQAAEGSMSVRQLFGLVIPKVFGSQTTNPRDLPYWLSDSTLYRNGKWTYWESTFYSGLAVLVLGLGMFAGIKKDRFVQFCALAMAGALVIALGDHFFIYQLLYRYVPGFGSFRFPGRILFVWNILLPILAAGLFDKLRNRTLGARELKVLTVIAAATLALILFVGLGMAKTFWPELEISPERAQWASQQAWIAFALLLCCVTVVYLYHKKIISMRQFEIALPLLLVIDLFVFGFGQHTQTDESAAAHFAANRPVARFLSAQGQKEISRSNVRDFDNPGYMLLRRNQGMIDKIQILSGYNPLNLARKLPPVSPRAQLDLMNVRYAIQVDPTRQSMGLAENPQALERARMFYRWNVLENDSAATAYMQYAGFDYKNELVLDRTPPFPPAVGSPASLVKVLSYSENRIEISVSTDADGVLWLSELFYPAWICHVNKQPADILRADQVFRGVALTKGSHRVVFTYRSMPFALGLTGTLITLLVCGVLLLGEKRHLLPVLFKKQNR